MVMNTHTKYHWPIFEENKKCVANTNAPGINLGATDLDHARDTSSHGGKQVTLKSTNERQSYRADTKNRPRFFTFDL